MRSIRRFLLSLLPALTMAAVVVLLLLFFYLDTPALRHREDKAYRQTPGRDLNSQQQAAGASHSGPRSESGRNVILLSLARSGSSLTGDILSHAPSVYYVFEPFRKSEKSMWKEYEESTRKNKSREAIVENWKHRAMGILHSFMTCNFRDLDLSDLDSSFLRRYPRTESLGLCIFRTNTTALSSCLEQAERKCSQAKFRLLKVIRLMVRDLEPLLNSHPELVLVVLVRDPRASLWSRMNVFQEEQAQNRPSRFVHNICNTLDDDITAAAELHHRFPGRVKVLRYESLAEEPMKTSLRLYRYLGLEWNHHVENRVKMQTSASNTNKRARVKDNVKITPYSVTREDSAKAARAWRDVADWSFVETAQEKCFGAMRQLGYRLFRSEADLRDNTTLSYSPDDVMIEDDIILQ